MLSARDFGRLGLAALLGMLVFAPGAALAQHLRPEPLEIFEGNVGYAATGNGMMTGQSRVAPARPLPQPTQNSLDGVPEDAVLLKAWAVWSASMAPVHPVDAEDPAGVDVDVELTLPDGSTLALVGAADSHSTEKYSAMMPAPPLGAGPVPATYYTARADITEAMQSWLAEDAGRSLNGNWSLGGVDISYCDNILNLGSTYCAYALGMGGWSLLFFYESESITQTRRLYHYTGFGLIDVDVLPSVQLTVSGFVTPSTPAGQLTAFFLDTIDNGAGESIALSGNVLSDPCDTQGRGFVNNRYATHTVAGGCAMGNQGMDLDTFDLSGALSPLQQEAVLTINAGSDTFLTNWLVLSLDSLLPSFRSVKGNKRATPAAGSTLPEGCEIEYAIEVLNAGGDVASGVVVTDATPEGTTYVPGSAKLDGEVIGDGPGGANPLEAGFEITTRLGGPLPIGEPHSVTFKVTVDAGRAGEDVVNVGRIAADLVGGIDTNEARHSIVAEGDCPGFEPQCEADADCEVGRYCTQGFCNADCITDADCGDAAAFLCTDRGRCQARPGGNNGGNGNGDNNGGDNQTGNNGGDNGGNNGDANAGGNANGDTNGGGNGGDNNGGGNLGDACLDDQQCDFGLFCSNAGMCISVCRSDDHCDAGQVCTSRGRCVDGGAGNGGTGATSSSGCATQAPAQMVWIVLGLLLIARRRRRR